MPLVARKWFTIGALSMAVLLTGMASEVRADFEAALTAYRLGDHSKAFTLFEDLASTGHVKAQHMLGEMYRKGQGVPRNLQDAARWYQKAAELDYADAQYHLGLMYDEGLGVTLNDELALKWYEAAARNGVIDAQYNLALMYEAGEGATKDDSWAYAWFDVAANHGDPVAQMKRAELAATMTQQELDQATVRSQDLQSSLEQSTPHRSH